MSALRRLGNLAAIVVLLSIAGIVLVFVRYGWADFLLWLGTLLAFYGLGHAQGSARAKSMASSNPTIIVYERNTREHHQG